MKKVFNKKTLGYTALALALVMIGMAFGTAQPAASAEEKVVLTSPFTEAIAKVRNSVVGINNYQIVNNYSNGYGGSYNPFSDFFGGFGGFGGYGYGYGNGNGNQDSSREVQYGSGSGVVVAEKYVLTNYHVVEDASSLKVAVAVDGKEEPDLLEAHLVAFDADVDVAVLYVPELTLAPVELGDSDTLQVGDWAICIGNPIGFTGTVTAGIISSLNREIATGSNTDKYGRKTETVNTMIQTDAAINSGNSGGGMFNTAGQLVGIPTLKYTGTRYSSNASVESIGMCIPINDAKKIIEEGMGRQTEADVPKGNTAARSAGDEDNSLKGKPRMGVSITTLTGNAVNSGILPRGAYVAEVEKGSPAEAAGIQVGDIIVEADGQIIKSTTDLQNLIRSKDEGATFPLRVYRTGIDLNEPQTEIPEDCDYIDLEITLAIVDAIAQ
ncbi:MAG: trypsin-like peptidase domain-containing protein [Clostridia bacterium]|nr:trypsin-like peptidase domain-containing protein [Clostridia bacterium]